jgi:hydrogenase maturation protease
MSWPDPIRVVGCGSPRGDDAAGWEAIRLLREHVRSQATIELYTADGGHQILDVLDGQGTFILVDAALSGHAPGTIHRLDWPSDSLETLRLGSTHHVRPAEALQLAATLGLLPPLVIAFGIEAERFDAEKGLSDAVASAVAQLVGRILQEGGRESLSSGVADTKRRLPDPPCSCN